MADQSTTTTQPPTLNFTHSPSTHPFTVPQQTYIQTNPSLQFSCIGTGALVFTTDKSTPRVLLVQRSSSDSMPNKWEIPGGACDDTDPSILHAVARELYEEAGLTATHIRARVGEPQIFGISRGRMVGKFNFLVEVEDGVEVRLDPDEHQNYVWASLEQVKARRVGEVELVFTARELEEVVVLAFGILEGGEGVGLG